MCATRSPLFLFALSSWLLLGCPSPSTADGQSGKPPTGASTVTAAPATAGAASAQPSSTSSSPTPEASATAALPDAAYCSKDDDCGWDDDCKPQRCQNKRSGPPAACDKTLPTPGTCACFDKWCALRPNARHRPPDEAQPCESAAQCAVDVGGARCVAVKSARDVIQVGPIMREGAYCECVEGNCAHRWHEPLSCKSDADCWWERKGGRLKPARPDKPRKLPFKPCKDGEVDGVCADGTCVVRGWEC